MLATIYLLVAGQSYIGSAIGQALGSEFTKVEQLNLQQNHIQTAHVTADKQYNQAQMHANGVNTDPALNNDNSQVPNTPTPELNKAQNPAPNPQQPLAIRTDYFNAHPNQNYFPSDDVPPANEAPRPAPPSANVQKPKVIVPKAQPAKAANDPIIPKKITTAASTIAHDAAKMLKNEWQSLRDDVATTANDVEKVALPLVAKAMPYIADGIVYVKNELDSVVNPIRKIASGANHGVNSSLSNLGHMTEHVATDAYQGAKLTFTDPTQALNNFKNNAAGFRQDINHVGGEVAQSINHLGGEIAQGAQMTWNHPAQALQNVSANVARGANHLAANIGHDVDYLEHASAYQYGEMLGNGLVLAAGAVATDGLGEFAFAAGGDIAAGAAARAGLGARLGDEAGAGVKFATGLDANGAGLGSRLGDEAGAGLDATSAGVKYAAGLDATGAGLDSSSDAASEMATRARLNSSNASVFAKAAVESDEAASAASAAGAAVRNGVFVNKEIKASRMLSKSERISSNMVNKPFINDEAIAEGWKPPYPANRSIRKITTAREMKLYRVHTSLNKPGGKFFAREKELAHIIDDPAALRSHFGLPDEPVYITEVNVPANTELYVGRIGSQPSFGKSVDAGFQYQSLDWLPRDSFTNTKLLQQSIPELTI